MHATQKKGLHKIQNQEIDNASELHQADSGTSRYLSPPVTGSIRRRQNEAPCGGR
jgi:hypothetical protein